MLPIRGRSREERRGEADGELDDDLGDLAEAVADVRRAFRKKDSAALLGACDRAEREILDMRAEGRQMET